jgi:hypothetical protein
VCLLALAVGCASKPPDPPVTSDTEPVRQRFAALEAALKAQDADVIWNMLSTKSREDAERIAKEARAAYATAGPDAKKSQAQALGLSEKEMAALTGKAVLKSKPFRKKYDDLPGSKVNQVVVTDDSATVHYVDTEGDNEKLIFVREAGAWQAWLRIPRARTGP